MANNKPIPLPILSVKQIETFWSHVDRRGPDECWPWSARRDNDGYGRIVFNGKDYRSHRIALFLVSGIDPGPLQALHTCDYPPCCNGAHLTPGTHMDNVDDMLRKGRGSLKKPDSWVKLHPERMRGENNYNTRLNPEKVREIRSLYKAGGITYKSLGSRFGVSDQAIYLIVLRKNWMWVD